MPSHYFLVILATLMINATVHSLAIVEINVRLLLALEIIIINTAVVFFLAITKINATRYIYTYLFSAARINSPTIRCFV